MNINLNQVTFGNPFIESIKAMEKPSLFDDLFDSIKNQSFPENDSEKVKEELNIIGDALVAIRESDNKDYLKRYRAYDKSMQQAITSIFLQKGIDISDIYTSVASDVEPFLLRLKYLFNRPRPFQLSHYFKFKLFAFSSTSSNTPSYPCGHSLTAGLVLNVIGSKYPSHYHSCLAMIDDISNSRLYLGLNYPSDMAFSESLCAKMLRHPSFTKKHSI